MTFSYWLVQIILEVGQLISVKLFRRLCQMFLKVRGEFYKFAELGIFLNTIQDIFSSNVQCKPCQLKITVIQ